uniref:Putative secreted protein n=1 Tax=Ixodes ricinus TaxID=34613 RepID=A0A6B0TYH2_IXORI
MFMPYLMQGLILAQRLFFVYRYSRGLQSGVSCHYFYSRLPLIRPCQRTCEIGSNHPKVELKDACEILDILHFRSGGLTFL